MSKRQVRKMLQLMAGGEPVALTNSMASVKKIARLAFIAQQFGYEYADAQYTGSRNNVLKMLIVPDHSPQARARAAQNWAQYPNAADGVSLPPVVPDALELLKARIQFDLTGKNAEKRMLYGAGGITLGLILYTVRKGGGAFNFIAAGAVWVIFMGIMGIGFLVTRRRNAKFAARLQAAGFMPVTDEGGRLRHLPPGTQVPGLQQWQQPQPPQQPQQHLPQQWQQPQPPQQPQPQYGQTGAYTGGPYGNLGNYGNPGNPGGYGQAAAPGPYSPQQYPNWQQPPQSPQPPQPPQH
ncbi:hypothetical protein [Streptomyces sp. NPDC001435]|uniref:hypothetical protein n=1 Tax=Streptomyces sp. NPDC001435 TaxID=3364576 RepID=UPI0036A88998